MVMLMLLLLRIMEEEVQEEEMEDDAIKIFVMINLPLVIRSQINFMAKIGID